MQNVLGNDAGWPILLGLTIIPGIIQVKQKFVSLIMVKEVIDFADKDLKARGRG